MRAQIDRLRLAVEELEQVAQARDRAVQNESLRGMDVARESASLLRQVRRLEARALRAESEIRALREEHAVMRRILRTQAGLP